MKYRSVILEDIANGNGVGVSLFIQGCSHHCPGCFNPESWDFDDADCPEFDSIIANTIIAQLNKPYINHLSILGGEPLEPRNLFPLACFIKQVKDNCPDKEIWLWTGCVWEILQETIRITDRAGYLEYILKNVDYLIDGPFIQEQKDLALQWRGSRNQRIIKSAESMKLNEQHFTDSYMILAD